VQYNEKCCELFSEGYGWKIHAGLMLGVMTALMSLRIGL
jgi:hypothetical protein